MLLTLQRKVDCYDNQHLEATVALIIKKKIQDIWGFLFIMMPISSKSCKT